MVAVERTRRKRAGMVEVECPQCHERMNKRILKQHERYACQAILRTEDESEQPPGTIVGAGYESHKKPWTWAKVKENWPPETWITEAPTSNPIGGIIWMGLHIDLIPNRAGCFISYGSRPGQNPQYSPGIPPPHWNIYRDYLQNLLRPSEMPLGKGEGIPMPIVAGGLEPQYVIDTETGQRHEVVLNPDGSYDIR